MNTVTINQESILNSQIKETKEYLGVVDEFRADGCSTEKAQDLATQLLNSEKARSYVSLAELHLKFKTGVDSKFKVQITEQISNDHNLVQFVKRFLSEHVEASHKANPHITSKDFSYFLSLLDQIQFYYAPQNNGDIVQCNIEVDTLL